MLPTLEGGDCSGATGLGGPSFLSGDGGTGEGVRMVTFENMMPGGSSSNEGRAR